MHTHDKRPQDLLTMEQIFGSQWAKVGHRHHGADVLRGYCWALDSLLALEHYQVFALFVAVHPAVCGQDTHTQLTSLLLTFPSISLTTKFMHCFLVKLSWSSLWS